MRIDADRGIVGLLVLLAMFSGGPAAQEQLPRPVFRAGIELLELDVSVLDGQRRPIRDLTAADFTVFEDGVERSIRAFTAVDLPARERAIQPVWADAAPPDVATNAIGEQDGRLVVILMDRTIPPGQPTVTARNIAVAAVNALGPNDLAALVSTSGGVPQNLTSDKGRLIEAIDQRDWSTDTTKEAKEVAPTLDPALQSSLSDGRCLCGLCVLNTVTRVSDALRNAPHRRKSLLFIGNSLIVQADLTNPHNDVGCDRLVRDARKTMVDSLALSNLTVHSLDPAGLVNVGPQSRGDAPNGLNPGAAAVRLQQQQDDTNALLRNQDSLGVLPGLTGGRTVVSTNAPEEKVPDIFRESETYYVLGVEPGAPGRPDARRSIEVKVRRRGAHVYAQHEYLQPEAVPSATASSPAASLGAALGGLLPAAAAPLRIALSARAAADGAGATVDVALDASAFVPATAATVPLEVEVAALDQTGRLVASARQRSIVSMPPASERPAPVPAREVVAETHLDLPAGDYEIRAAVRPADGSGPPASVFSHIVIAAFGRDPLSLSDPVLFSRGSIVPTLRREFRQGDGLQASLTIYQGTGRTDALKPVSLRVQTLDARGTAVHSQELTFSDADFQNRRAQVQLPLALDDLPAGEYLLRFDAASGDHTATRAVRFTVAR